MSDGLSVATLFGIIATLVTLAVIAMRAGQWRERVEQQIKATSEAVAALSATVADGSAAVNQISERLQAGDSARQELRDAVDQLGERFEAGDAARQGIQNTLNNVARALNPGS